MEEIALLKAIVCDLVEYQDSIEIVRSVDNMGVLLTLRVHKDDMGKIIGRTGSMAQALRTVLRGAGAKLNSRVNLKVLEPEGSERIFVNVKTPELLILDTTIHTA